MKTFDSVNDYEGLLNNLYTVIDNFTIATNGKLTGEECREQLLKLNEVLTFLRYQGE